MFYKRKKENSKMEPGIRSLTNLLVASGVFLVLVTILSFGIRHFRFSMDQAETDESSIATNPEDKSISEMQSSVSNKQDYYTEGFDIDGNKSGSQYSDRFDIGDEVSSEDYFDENIKPGKQSKSISTNKPDKGDYVKPEYLQIPLSDYEDLYIDEKGKITYVAKNPDGSIIKEQAQIDPITGELIFLENFGLQKIALNNNENLYITSDNELWYVNEAGLKMQLHVNDMTGDVTIGEAFLFNQTNDNAQDK
ncbi:MAG: hypothetical protein JXA96_18370 [Sedimentisphaerales bacterium]|nr:hypothetical protein [Sedimentisphaerales bacterium]